VVFYRELYDTQVGEADQARRILGAEAPGEHVAVRFGDDAMFASRGDAKPISTVYRENGCHLTPANKGARVPGWQRLRTYLAEAPACLHHRAMGWETCPMMHIFSTLKEFYRTLSDIPHAVKGDPEDADSDGEDHLPDCARYLLINLGGGAEQWIRWARAKAIQAGASVDGLPPARPEPRPAIEPPQRRVPAVPAEQPEAAQEPPLEGVVVDAAAARKRARDEAFRASPDAIMLRAISSR
jgi:hypothetical protein